MTREEWNGYLWILSEILYYGGLMLSVFAIPALSFSLWAMSLVDEAECELLELVLTAATIKAQEITDSVCVRPKIASRAMLRRRDAGLRGEILHDSLHVSRGFHGRLEALKRLDAKWIGVGHTAQFRGR